MTYSTWKISEAKARLAEVVGACREEPQLLYNRGKPVAAIVGIESFAAYQRWHQETQQPSMALLLDELDHLNRTEADFGEAPLRKDRTLPELD